MGSAIALFDGINFDCPFGLAEYSHNFFYIFSSIWRRMRWVGHVAHMGRGVYRVLVGKPEGKSLLGRPRHGWIFRKLDGWYGLCWLRIEVGGGHLSMQ